MDNYADRRRMEVVPEDVAELRKQRHREAQAHYREANRVALRVHSWQYRLVLVLSLCLCNFKN